MSDSPVTVTPTLAEIEAAALRLRQRLDSAAQIATAVDAEMTEIRTRHAESIRAAAADAAAARAEVLALVDTGRALFRRPKSRVMHGLKVGLRQTGGAWSWPDAPGLVALVRQRLAPSRAAALIQVAETVQISTVTPEDRTRLGIARTPAVDRPICTEADADTIGRLIALLGDDPDYIPLPPGQGKTAAIEEPAA